MKPEAMRKTGDSMRMKKPAAIVWLIGMVFYMISSTVAAKAFHDVLSFPVAMLVSLPLIVLLAYTILGITGFGSSIVAMPLMVNFVPIQFAVPMIVLLDMFASSLIGVKNHGSIARAEVGLVVPFLFVGIALGATVLVNAPTKWLMLGLGVFVLCYVAHSILIRVGAKPIGRIWAAPLGTLGGVFSALFGTGGPVYAIYLTRRLEDKSVLRATMGTVVSVSSIARVAAFAIAGLYSQSGVFMVAAGLIPFMLVGLWCGNRLHYKLSARRVAQGLWALLVVSSVSLIVRSLML